MVMPERSFSSGNYRYGFNGKEQDPEIKGEGAQYDYGFRIYDPRLGRFLSTDPLFYSYPWFTPYQFSGNTPIAAIDLDGLESMVVIRRTGDFPIPAQGTPRDYSIQAKMWESGFIHHLLTQLKIPTLNNPEKPLLGSEYIDLTPAAKEKIVIETMKQFLVFTYAVQESQTSKEFSPDIGLVDRLTVIADLNYDLLGGKEQSSTLKTFVHMAAQVAEEGTEIFGTNKNIGLAGTVYLAEENAHDGKYAEAISNIASAFSDWGLDKAVEKKWISSVAKTGFSRIIGVLGFILDENTGGMNHHNDFLTRQRNEVKQQTISALLLFFLQNNQLSLAPVKVDSMKEMQEKRVIQDNCQVVNPVPIVPLPPKQ